jgi:hypothetical protein
MKRWCFGPLAELVTRVTLDPKLRNTRLRGAIQTTHVAGIRTARYRGLTIRVTAVLLRVARSCARPGDLVSSTFVDALQRGVTDRAASASASASARPGAVGTVVRSAVVKPVVHDPTDAVDPGRFGRIIWSITWSG